MPELSIEEIGADVSIRGYIDDSLSPQEAPTKDYPRGSQRTTKRRATQPILLTHLYPLSILPHHHTKRMTALSSVTSRRESRQARDRKPRSEIPSKPLNRG